MNTKDIARESETAIDTATQRIRNILANIDLDCSCKERLNEALDRYDTLDGKREYRRYLLDARLQKEKIESLIVFLEELDRHNNEKPDIALFSDFQCIFTDIKNAAEEGISASKHISEILKRRQ